MPQSGSGSGGSGTGPIPVVSGCFLWYYGSTITGVPTGGNVTSWLDSSGSGNNLTGLAFNTLFPVYQPNVINGWPVVRFSGFPYLSTMTNNPSLNFSPSSVTLFCVFSTPNLVIEQTLFANDNVTDRKSSFIVGLNGDVPINATGWYFGYGKNGAGTNNGMFSAEASSIYNANQFYLRHDRFRLSDNQFCFGLMGNDTVSGTANTRVSTNNVFKVGLDETNDNHFLGDIAEIVGYDHRLTDTETSFVNTYLYNKYFVTSRNPFTQPDDLLGCFVWLRSSSIGTTNNGNVGYWKDESGSGNHVHWIDYPANSSSAGFPVYKTLVLNNFPAVRYSGNTYLSTTGNNGSLTFSPSDLTAFCVYSTTGNFYQSIYGISNATSGNAFIVALNDSGNVLNPSGFQFAYGSGFTNTIYHQEANTSPSNIILNVPNTPTLRHDRFLQDGTFSFGYFGADVASGQATTSYSVNNILTVGNSNNISGSFNGDIFEIICYSPKLSDYDTELVNEYLIHKYMLPNAGSFNLFTTGSANSGLYKGIDLYQNGYVRNSGNTPLFIKGYSAITGSKTLYIGSTSVRNSGISLYVSNIGNSSGHTTLYTESALTFNSGLSLYEYGKSSNSKNTSLFIYNKDGSTAATPLYVGSSIVLRSSGVPLSISGTLSQFHQAPLYTQAQFQTIPWIKLYIGGKSSNESNKTLYISSNNNSSHICTLFTVSKTSAISPLTLFVRSVSHPSNTGVFSLYVNAASSNTSGLYVGKPLFLQGGRITAHMPLYVGVSPVNTKPFSSMPLYISGPIHTGVSLGTVTLFAGNYFAEAFSPTKRLFVRGEGGLAGGQSANAVMPLYINTYPGLVAPMFIAGASPSHSTTLCISGAYNTIRGMDLFTYGSPLQSGVSLYISGPSGFSGEVSMYVKGLPLEEQSTTIFTHGF